MTNKQTIDGLSRAALEALKSARLFISNGIDLGFIRMPDSETPDPAHNTLPMIDKAIQELRAILDKTDTPYVPKGDWSFEYIEGGDIVIRNGKDWTIIKRGDGPIYEQFLYRFCEGQMRLGTHVARVRLPGRPRADEDEYGRMTDYEKGLIHGGIELWDKIDELNKSAQQQGESVATNREQFEAWVLGREHPTYGWLDRHWLTRGDNPETYADLYVQGLWVASQSLYAEQPAPMPSQPQGEPVAWVSPESLGGVRWRPKVLDGLADGAPLYCRPPEQVAPLATEAAKAFAKGFNTLESGGGKYRINMQFQSREDAWGAFNVLARLKQLNTCLLYTSPSPRDRG